MDRKQQVEWSPVQGTEPREIKGIWAKTKLENDKLTIILYLFKNIGDI